MNWRDRTVGKVLVYYKSDPSQSPAPYIFP